MLELGEKYEYNGRELFATDYGRHIISEDNEAECSVYVRKELFYYLDRAYYSANICQQKIGTHGESYYGFFTMAFYVKTTNNDTERKKVLSLFNKFFSDMTINKHGKIRLKQRALPHRLQNVSTLISILVDMYEISSDKKYLDYANDLAEFLMSLQSKDGSYRSHGTHYTCVIYPAKSMLELATIEKKVGLIDRYNTHFSSAVRAIDNLNTLKDNIQTEGQMTFEDGMISCEALQLAFLATLVDDEKLKKSYTDTAEMILEKHTCLEQIAIPDCRCIGATLRFWEARYDINFRSNMLNCPHGWTSWKNYASYYLYILTGKRKYLKDLMNTIGACLQMIDENGILNWAFILDPYVVGEKMVKSNKLQGFDFETYVVSEEYLPMVSDWHRQKPKVMPMQYIINFSKLGLLFDKHGSCDNDVHEHFKCIEECIFGKIFIHLENENQVLYNCYIENNTYYTKDKYAKQAIVYSEKVSNVNIMDKDYTLNKGINIIDL